MSGSSGAGLSGGGLYRATSGATVTVAVAVTLSISVTVSTLTTVSTITSVEVPVTVSSITTVSTITTVGVPVTVSSITSVDVPVTVSSVTTVSVPVTVTTFTTVSVPVTVTVSSITTVSVLVSSEDNRPPLSSQTWDGIRAYEVSHVTVASNKLYVSPWLCPDTGTFDRLSIYITEGASPGLVKLAIVSLDPVAKTGALIGEITADLLVATSGLREGTLSPPVSLVAGGIYGLGAVFSGTPEIRTYNVTATHGGGFTWVVAETSDATNYTRYEVSLTYAAGVSIMPELVSLTYGTGAPGGPVMGIRKA